MATGLSNQEIADELVLALGTVARYTNNIFTKLNVRNRTQAISRAQALGLI
jgi:ATP/maltotriose-dependent transcriptional regulator MalT